MFGIGDRLIIQASNGFSVRFTHEFRNRYWIHTADRCTDGSGGLRQWFGEPQFSRSPSNKRVRNSVLEKFVAERYEIGKCNVYGSFNGIF